jgi:hypothetical protein
MQEKVAVRFVVEKRSYMYVDEPTDVVGFSGRMTAGRVARIVLATQGVADTPFVFEGRSLSGASLSATVCVRRAWPVS